MRAGGIKMEVTNGAFHLVGKTEAQLTLPPGKLLAKRVRDQVL